MSSLGRFSLVLAGGDTDRKVVADRRVRLKLNIPAPSLWISEENVSLHCVTFILYVINKWNKVLCTWASWWLPRWLSRTPPWRRTWLSCSDPNGPSAGPPWWRTRRRRGLHCRRKGLVQPAALRRRESLPKANAWWWWLAGCRCAKLRLVSAKIYFVSLEANKYLWTALSGTAPS